MARDRQTGSRFSEDGKRLLVVGGPPLLLEPVQASILLAGARPKKVRPLDIYGVPRDVDVPLERDGSFRIDGRYRAMYYHVAR